MHGAGSPQAQRIQIMRNTDMQAKKGFARNLAGVGPREVGSAGDEAE